MSNYDKQINDALRLKLGGPMRLAVLKRIKQAALDGEEYTEEQFTFWIDCLKSAAGWVEDNTVAAGIYRDMGELLAAKGDREDALQYLQGSLDMYPDSPLRAHIEQKIEELKK